MSRKVRCSRATERNHSKSNDSPRDCRARLVPHVAVLKIAGIIVDEGFKGGHAG